MRRLSPSTNTDVLNQCVIVWFYCVFLNPLNYLDILNDLLVFFFCQAHSTFISDWAVLFFYMYFPHILQFLDQFLFTSILHPFYYPDCT